MASSGLTGKLMTLSVNGAAVAESRNFTLTMNRETVDVTSRDSSRWRELVQSTRSWSISFEGLYIYTDVGKRVLQYNWSADGTAITVILTLADGTITTSGSAILTELTYEGPFADAATMSGTLEGTTTLTISAS